MNKNPDFLSKRQHVFYKNNYSFFKKATELHIISLQCGHHELILLTTYQTYRTSRALNNRLDLYILFIFALITDTCTTLDSITISTN